MKLKDYLNDGANWQAKCVLNYLQSMYSSILDKTYVADYGYYKANIEVGRFENCREQGYVFSLRYKFKQKNYCVYEHMNSDNLIVLINDTYTINTPTLDEMWAGKKDKWDYDKDFKYGQILECGNFIAEDMKKFIDLVDEFESMQKEQETNV